MKKGWILFFILLFAALTLGPAQAARDKDTVVIVQGADPTTMDPHNHMETPAWNVHIQLYDTLLQRTPDIKRENLLAESYRIVNDKTWEFKIRKDVKFHNGEDLKAENFKFTFERMADPKLKLRQTVFQGVIERVEVMDDYTFRIVTKDPYPVMDAMLCIYGQPLPIKYFQEKGPEHFSLNPVGTGPYKFVRWVKDDYILLEANEKYFRGAPKVKKIRFRPIPEATTRVAALQTRDARAQFRQAAGHLETLAVIEEVGAERADTHQIEMVFHPLAGSLEGLSKCPRHRDERRAGVEAVAPALQAVHLAAQRGMPLEDGHAPAVASET